AEAQRPKRMRVLADGRSGVGGVGDEDLLTGEADVNGVLEALHVERPLVGLELHQVERQQVARRVVEEHELRTRVGGVDPACVGDDVPVLDRAVELDSRATAGPCTVCDTAYDVYNLIALKHSRVGHR